MGKRVEGYWYSDGTPEYPIPKPNELSDEQAKTICGLILKKQNEARLIRYKGMSFSRITNERLGSTEYELDDWYWPSDFAVHYVLEHKVKPTDDFLRFIGYL